MKQVSSIKTLSLSLSLSLLLLDGDLKNHLHLDGTHVNPKYVTLLEKAFHNL